MPNSAKAASATGRVGGGHEPAFDDAEIGIEDHAAVEGAKRRRKTKRIAELAKTDRRPTGDQRQADSCLRKPRSGDDHAVGKAFVAGDEGTVHIGNQKRDALGGAHGEISHIFPCATRGEDEAASVRNMHTDDFGPNVCR